MYLALAIGIIIGAAFLFLVYFFAGMILGGIWLWILIIWSIISYPFPKNREARKRYRESH